MLQRFSLRRTGFGAGFDMDQAVLFRLARRNSETAQLLEETGDSLTDFLERQSNLFEVLGREI